MRDTAFPPIDYISTLSESLWNLFVIEVTVAFHERTWHGGTGGRGRRRGEVSLLLG